MKKIKMTLLGMLSVIVAACCVCFPVKAQESNYDAVFDEEELEALTERVEVKSRLFRAREKQNTKGLLKGTGSYPRRKGNILVTSDAYKNLIPTGHAAIVYSSNSVVEALANGVVKGKNNWNTSKRTCWGVTVSWASNSEEAAASDWCYRQIGKPYNYNYLNTSTRSCFYCSQLVWAAFKDMYGVDLNTPAFGNAVHPLELVDSGETTILYQK